VLRLGSHDGCQTRILDDFRLDLTADVRVRHCIGHFRRSDEAAGLVVTDADPVVACANTEVLCDESSQRVHKAPRGLLARLDGTFASASGTADSGLPLGGFWGPLLGLADQSVDATTLLSVVPWVRRRSSPLSSPAAPRSSLQMGRPPAANPG
jgi:hypothetical protein